MSPASEPDREPSAAKPDPAEHAQQSQDPEFDLFGSLLVAPDDANERFHDDLTAEVDDSASDRDIAPTPARPADVETASDAVDEPHAELAESDVLAVPSEPDAVADGDPLAAVAADETDEIVVDENDDQLDEPDPLPEPELADAESSETSDADGSIPGVLTAASAKIIDEAPEEPDFEVPEEHDLEVPEEEDLEAPGKREFDDLDVFARAFDPTGPIAVAGEPEPSVSEAEQEPAPADREPRSGDASSNLARAASTESAPAKFAEQTNEPGIHTGALSSRVHAARDEFEHQVAAAREQFEEANERIKQRAGRDLFAAIGIGVIAGGAMLAALVFAPPVVALLALIVAVLGVHELWRAFRTAGRRIDLIPQLISVGVILAASFWGDLTLLWIALFAAIAFVVVWRLLAQMIAQDGRHHREVISDVLVGGFLPLYVPFLVATAIVVLGQEDGNMWVLSFLIVVVTSDTLAYATGLAFGKHPLAPRVSPKKTWEGFGGSAIGALGAGVMVSVLLLDLPPWAGLIFGGVLLISATIGDLGESMIKRDLGIKDMSSALPGHGGVLDRLDSVLPSAVATLALYTLLSPLAG